MVGLIGRLSLRRSSVALSLLIAAFIFSNFATTAHKKTSASKPNVLIILTSNCRSY